MSVIRGTALANYPRLVAELGGDPVGLLRAVGISPRDVGDYEVFIPFRAAIQAVESAAVATGTLDFGRRLASQQGIEILGPVGVAARTAPTVADALAIFETFMAAYSPAISTRVSSPEDPARIFMEVAFTDRGLPAHPQNVELALGVTMRVLRFLLGSDYLPLSVHLPHERLSPAADYRQYFGCRPYFAERTTGFTLRAADLGRPLHRDELAHRAVVQYLATITVPTAAIGQSVRTIVRQLLPTGTVTVELIASQLSLHPKTLQRRLADDGTTFAALTDEVRREVAERYLRDTGITLSHLTRELGYAEQSVLTRSCRRWFGCGPAGYRKRLKCRPLAPSP